MAEDDTTVSEPRTAHEASLEEIAAKVQAARAQYAGTLTARRDTAAPASVASFLTPGRPMPAGEFRDALDRTLARAAGSIARIEAQRAATSPTPTPLPTPEERARLAQLRRERLTAIARSIGVPEDGTNAVFATTLDPRAPKTRILRAFVERLAHHRTHRTPVLFVASSPPGYGKTAGMCWSAVHQPAPAIEAMFVKSSDAALLVPWGESAERYRRARTVPLLLLDETGGEVDPTRITELIEYRWDYGLATFATANLNRADWWKRFGSDRMRSRIGPHGDVSKIAEFAGLPDLRQPAARTELRKAGAQ